MITRLMRTHHRRLGGTCSIFYTLLPRYPAFVQMDHSFLNHETPSSSSFSCPSLVHHPHRSLARISRDTTVPRSMSVLTQPLFP